MLNNKRLILSTGLGAILGLFCVIGVSGRVPISGNELFFIGMWYNRVVMGFMIGLAGEIFLINNEKLNPVVRGALLGLFITSAIFLSSQAKDIMSFFAGIAYGIIIDVFVTWYVKRS